MYVPLWMFIVACVLIVILVYLRFVRNPLPFPDWGNAGFILSDDSSRQALINVLREHGLSPDLRADTPGVSRAIYHSKFPFILDVDSPEIAEKVGNPESYLAIKVKNPVVAAKGAYNCLLASGYMCKVIHDPDPSLPPGKLSVVTSPAFPGKMLVFRRHVLLMGKRPTKWRDMTE